MKTVLQKFVEFSRAKAPAKYQRPFKKHIEAWLGSLSKEEAVDLQKNLASKKSLWPKISGDLLDIFYKEIGV